MELDIKTVTGGPLDVNTTWWARPARISAC